MRWVDCSPRGAAIAPTLVSFAAEIAVSQTSGEEIPESFHYGCIVLAHEPGPKLSKLELEALYLSILRARRPFHCRAPRRPTMQLVARHMIGTFLWTLVHRKRLRKIGRTAFERRGARMAVIAPGVRQLLRRKDDGNELAGVFKRQNVASVVAEYSGICGVVVVW
jgi:hypothetical protein